MSTGAIRTSAWKRYNWRLIWLSLLYGAFLLPAVYGFAAGHLCGLMFRKLVVACGVAGILGGAGAALWEPSRSA